MNADQALAKVLSMEFETVLDLGSGQGLHAEIFRENNKDVTTIALSNADIVGDFIFTELGIFDCIWASHVLEHQRNCGAFLDKCFGILKDDGILAITVPPSKSEIVGGHLSLWNAGLLLYNLILAGFDCSSASVKKYGYNISVIVKKKKAALPSLKMDFGDIEKIARFFPFEATHGFNGELEEINW